MSEVKPDDPRGGPKHVESTVLGEEGSRPAEARALPDPAEQPVPSEQIQSFDAHVAGADELAAAKYFSIAFLVVIIPLGLIILGMVTVAFVKSLDALK